jgi:4-amino-4-deoxy-L-arabinose transferase-like glycosyltransferase
MARVAGIAVGTVVVHFVLGWRYGFDRDELMALEDARHLAWGYVQYPPMTAFFGRLALGLFGTSLGGFRLFAALAQAAALVLTGWMAKEMGGGKWAQVAATLAGVPFCLGAGGLMQYISFDYLCWVLVAWCVVRVAGSDQRWWVGVGVGMGLGMMAKYTMGFLVCGVVAGVLFTNMRRYLRSGWLWLGVALAWAIWLPNLLWEWKRNFVSLEFLKFLHVRDVQTGQTDWFLLGQAEVTLLALPLALAGIWFCFFSEEGRRFRILGWMYTVPLAMFLVMRGRDYYLAPAYPMLYAAGAVWVEGVFENGKGKIENRWRWVRGVIWVCLVLDILVAGAVALPVAPVNSAWWRLASRVDGVFPEEIGWEEFVNGVAQVRDALPAEDRGRLGILVGNYGEVGALNLYGEKFGLPRAVSGVNSSWERGYGEPAPEVLIVVGYPRELLEREFASCVVAGRTRNRFAVKNEETVEDPDIFVCRGMRRSWGEFWERVRKFA